MRQPRTIILEPTATPSFSHPTCFARGYGGGCSEELEKEHFISKSILEVIDRIGGGLRVTGMPWQAPGQQTVVSPRRAFTAHILCKRHNRGLSPLDKSALQLFERLSDLRAWFDEPRVHDNHHALLVSGHDIERWMLKALIGACVSGNAQLPEGHPSDWMAPDQWLEVLFGRSSAPRGCGMYFLPPQENPARSKVEVEFAALGGPQPVGMKMSLCGLWFILALFVPTGTEPELRGAHHRPASFVFKEGRRRRVVWVSWPGASVPALNDSVHVEWRRD